MSKLNPVPDLVLQHPDSLPPNCRSRVNFTRRLAGSLSLIAQWSATLTLLSAWQSTLLPRTQNPRYGSICPGSLTS